jgi:hypothetical protein
VLLPIGLETIFFANRFLPRSVAFLTLPTAVLPPMSAFDPGCVKTTLNDMILL